MIFFNFHIGNLIYIITFLCRDFHILLFSMENSYANFPYIAFYMRQEVKLVYAKVRGCRFFEDFRTHIFQSVKKYLDVVGTWLIVRLKVDDPYF